MQQFTQICAAVMAWFKYGRRRHSIADQSGVFLKIKNRLADKMQFIHHCPAD